MVLELGGHLEGKTVDLLRRAAYPSGKGADCNSVLPGSTPGAASIFSECRSRLLDKTNSVN